MLQFRIIYDAKNTEQAVVKLNTDVINPLAAKLKALGYNTRDVMRQNIVTKRGVSTGTLASKIDTEIVEDAKILSVGVGNISVLNANAPYWYVVNYGKRYDTGADYIPPAVVGSFNGNRPDSNLKGKGTEKLIVDGKFGIFPKSSIRPMNFIESTLTWLTGQLSTFK